MFFVPQPTSSIWSSLQTHLVKKKNTYQGYNAKNITWIWLFNKLALNMHKERYLSHRKVQYRLNRTKTWKILMNAKKAMIKAWTHKVSSPKYKNIKGLWQLAMTERRLKYQPILMYYKWFLGTKHIGPKLGKYISFKWKPRYCQRLELCQKSRLLCNTLQLSIKDEIIISLQYLAGIV